MEWIRFNPNIDSYHNWQKKDALGRKGISQIRHFEGLTRKDDLLPPRFFNEPRRDDGKIIDRQEYTRMLGEYYDIRGWDKEGNPKRVPQFIKCEQKE